MNSETAYTVLNTGYWANYMVSIIIKLFQIVFINFFISLCLLICCCFFSTCFWWLYFSVCFFVSFIPPFQMEESESLWLCVCVCVCVLSTGRNSWPRNFIFSIHDLLPNISTAIYFGVCRSRSKGSTSAKNRICLYI